MSFSRSSSDIFPLIYLFTVALTTRGEAPSFMAFEMSLMLVGDSVFLLKNNPIVDAISFLLVSSIMCIY